MGRDAVNALDLTAAINLDVDFNWVDHGCFSPQSFTSLKFCSIKHYHWGNETRQARGKLPPFIRFKQIRTTRFAVALQRDDQGWLRAAARANKFRTAGIAFKAS